MNTDELIVMGVLIVLAGALMAARHFVHTMEVPAPMATRKVDTGNTEEEPSDYQLIPRMGDIEEIDKQMATLRQRIFAQDRRIAELEQRHERMVQDYENLIAAFSVAPARLAGLEQRHERMMEHYEDLIATFKEREAAMEYRLDELEHRV
tara:strand:+ start:1593 stop:2042 length:450 start_codon:yes stop_codon:yes gene_type:complete